MLPDAATPTGKRFPWKNVPPWPPLRHKLQQHSTTPLYNPTLDTFHTGSDSLESTLTELADLCYNQLPRIFRKKPQAHQNPFFFHTLTRSFPCPFLYSIEPHSMENLSQP